MANRIKFTAKKKETFLALIAEGWSVTKACNGISITPRCAYYHRETDPVFDAEWESAWQSGADRIEDEMLRRAVEGVTKPVYQGKELVGYIQEYSDTLLIFALKGRKPEKYRERQQTDLTSGGQPFKIHTIVVEKPGDE